MPWRPMLAGDIPAVFDLSVRIHPGYPESEPVLAERQALAPEWCWLYEGREGPAGYFLVHPWRLGAPPALNALLGGLPDTPDTLYFHDLALLPETRGTGAASDIVRRSIAAAHPFKTISLVAVNGTAPFWSRFGFLEETRPDLSGKLESYGPGTRYMVRRV
ncbi:GNAT family N-acetyltransferase [Pelagibacterium xiamenense]|uniref:GNAT family N-acetyltransferase n=1 Tax=Pelagibacterium xiamenense TaxID=2901140 RepID=UPI001E4AAF6B|nr:GNAT family N-acetyltransferase [Pelagibacterium xiamenense]MCD7058571.1 GNAT family N-acetyltransferase [Pelagibacterium xiamenense]